MKFTWALKITTAYVCLMSLHLSATNYIEKNGIVAIEAEDFASQYNDDKRRWFKFDVNTPKHTMADADATHETTASNGTYIELLPDNRTNHDEKLIPGENFTNNAGAMAVLSYPVYFNTPGKYYIWARAYSTGLEDNGLHIGLNGQWPESSQRLQWCKGKQQWTWSSAQRVDSHHCGYPNTVFVYVPHTGIHMLTISMREDGVEIDKFILTQDKNYQPKGADLAATKTVQKALANKKILHGIDEYSKILWALDYFDVSDSKDVPYYQHKDKRALAINAGKKSYRNKFAKAKYVFTGEEPESFDLTLVTLAETDGESNYQVLVNKAVIGKFKNPETLVDYKETYFDMKNINLKKNDVITVRSMAVTNGKIPENDETAFARGRWVALVMNLDDKAKANKRVR
jgi:hypothetical protein